MPSLTTDVLPAAIFRDHPQPILGDTEGLILRPWKLTDAPAVFEAFSDPSIQRWHVRSATSLAEVRTWIVAGWRNGRLARMRSGPSRARMAGRCGVGWR